MLRGFTIGDLDVHGAPVERTEVADALDHMINAFGDAPGFGFRAADDKQTGEFVGWFHFRPRADGTAAEPELGYRLRRSYWGRGLATEGARALIDKGFEELDIERVIAETMSVHRSSSHAQHRRSIRGDQNVDVDSRPPRSRTGNKEHHEIRPGSQPGAELNPIDNLPHRRAGSTTHRHERCG